MIYIGIDTGVHTGVAVWDSSERCFLMLKTLKIHVAMELVGEYVKYASEKKVRLKVLVEDPRKRKWFGTERMPREIERKRLQGVGSVKRDAAIWDDYLAGLGADYEMVEPKRNVTKLTQDGFKNITGYGKRTNEHERDAAMLVYGY